MTKAYTSLPWIVKVLLELFFGYPIAVIYRICRYLEKKNIVTLIVGLLCLVIGPAFWVIDFLTVLFTGKITILAD